MKTMNLFFVLIITFSFGCNKNSGSKECIRFKNYNDTYRLYKSSFDRDNYSVVSENKSINLKNFGQKINEYIIEEKIDSIIELISTEKFYFYTPHGMSENISEKLINELKNQEGYLYNFIFDISKSYKSDNVDPSFGQDMDIRKYLSCYEYKIEWTIVYDISNKFYIVSFSIPDWLIEHFSYFSYKVIEKDNRYILVGF